MNITVLILVVALTGFFAAGEIKAQPQQRRGPRPDRAGRTAPAQPPAAPAQPAAPPAPANGQRAVAQTKFQDLAVDSTFFFLSDTNHAYPWKKISDTMARNCVNTNQATIAAKTPVIKQ